MPSSPTTQPCQPWKNQPSIGLVFMMAISCGLCAGANYFNQPLIFSIADDLNITAEQSGFTIVLAQLGYAAGLFILVPLGDLFEKRIYICALMLFTALTSVALALSNNIYMLYTFTLSMSLFSVATQVLVPYVSTLFPPQRSAEVVGLLMSGVLMGILFARTIAGLVSTLWSWHAVYLLSGGLILFFAICLWFKLPISNKDKQLNLINTYKSLFYLSSTKPHLIRRGIIGGLAFGMLSIIFTTMTYLLAQSPYYFNDFQIGLFGTVGIAGIYSSQWTGKKISAGREEFVALLSTSFLILAWIPLSFAQKNLYLYVVGLIFAYFAISALHVLNQNLVYRISKDARSRINAIYMTLYFSGAALGSILALYCLRYYGWYTCVALGSFFAIIIFILNQYDFKKLSQQ